MVDLPPDIIELEDEPNHLSVMVFGPSGVGKTPFAASSERCLILRTEKGTASAKVRGSKAQVWPCDTWTKLLKAKRWLKKQAATDEGIPFDWISIDSGTSMQTIYLRHILAEEYKAAPDKAKRDLDIPQIQDHQKWQNGLKRNMQEFIDLPVNLCVTALPMTVDSEDDEGNLEETIIPQFLGQKGAIGWAIVGMFDMGGLVRLAKVKDGEDGTKVVQKIHWSKYGNHWGRDRYSALGNVTTNLTLDQLAEKVKNSMKG